MKIAWIGTGVMGGAMAGHLLAAGHEMIVFSRSKKKAELLLQRGACWAEDAATAAQSVEAVCSMVGFPADVEEVILGARGVIQTVRPGTLLIDFTTSSPRLAERIAAAAAGRGAAALDAPVSGGDIGAREARLSIMVGGDRAAFDRAQPIFRVLGKIIVYQGPPGYGQHTKMVNQILIAANMIGVCEGVLYAKQAGLNPETVLASVVGGAAASWSLSNLYPRILKSDFQPGFYVEHFIKDLQIALDEAGRMKLNLPGLALARQLYETVRQGGGGRLGTQALVLALASLNGIHLAATPPAAADGADGGKFKVFLTDRSGDGRRR